MIEMIKDFVSHATVSALILLAAYVVLRLCSLGV